MFYDIFTYSNELLMNYIRNTSVVRGLSRELESEFIQGSGFFRDGNGCITHSILFKIKKYGL